MVRRVSALSFLRVMKGNLVVQEDDGNLLFQTMAQPPLVMAIG